MKLVLTQGSKSWVGITS